MPDARATFDPARRMQDGQRLHFLSRVEAIDVRHAEREPYFVSDADFDEIRALAEDIFDAVAACGVEEWHQRLIAKTSAALEFYARTRGSHANAPSGLSLALTCVALALNEHWPKAYQGIADDTHFQSCLSKIVAAVRR